MATIIQKPDTLSLSRNLKELIISTSSEISLQLLKGDSMLLEETYLPDVNNRVLVDLAEIVTSSLSLTMPSGDAVSTSQSSVYSDFTVKVDGTSVAEFTAVRSGVERFSDTAANFLTANWLTWQPQVKEVLHDQPEWLTYYPASGSCACYARFYYTDGTSGEKKVCDVSQCVSINTRFSKLWALDESGKERYGVIDVYIKDAQGLRLTYVQRYVLCSQGALDEVYLCENSLGGLDSFRFYGDRKLVPEIGYTSLLLDNSYTAADPDLSRKWSQNTGMLTGRECEWCWELFRSSAAYHLYRGTILPIVLDASSVEKSAMSVLAAYSFDYRYASDLGLLNVVRSENLPEVVEISGPDAEVFFLTPRLNEFPSAVLSDDLIIPVQSPYEESWYTLSVGGLKSALLSSVETIYGPMWHVHDNLQVLNLLSADEKGNLLYNGLAVGSGIVGAHDHHGETIRPSVLVIPTTAPSVDSDLRPGEYAMYLDSSSAVDGETPTKAGLDEEELWSILGDSGAEKISKQHLPSDTVYSEDLDDCIKISDLNTLDLVTLSTAQTITGKKTFSEDVVLGGQRQDGSFAKAYIPSTAGAGLYFLVMDSSSAVDGETPTKAGLDEEELWATLSGNAGTEVVAKQHLPSDTVYGDGLAQTLLPYATQEWVAGRGYLTSVKLSTISDLDDGWDSMLAAAPAGYVTRWPKFSEVSERPYTIAGFGITDAYTKGEVNAELAKYVTLGTAQTVSGDKTHSGDVVFGAAKADGSGYGRMYVPSTAGAGLYFLVMDSSSAVDGETPTAGGGGIDEEELWAILSGNAGTEVVAKQHLPSDTVYGDGLAQTLLPYATQEWVAGSYMTTNTEQNITASKTVIGKPWAVRMSTDASNAIDGIIWKNVSGSPIAGLTYHNTERRIFINANHPDVTNIWEDTAGKYSLRVGWDELTYNSYPIMHSDNIGSYALTPSNYTSYLDSRYVNVSGDTMTGPLALPSITGSYSLKIGTFAGIQCDSTFGIVLQYESTFINVTNSGLKRNNSYTIWDSGNDGSGSGLDADTLDGVHNGSVTAAILASRGRETAITGKPDVYGMQMFEVYMNGYPCGYGNGLRFKGATSNGCGELLLGWSGSNNGIEHIYYRNNRDMAETWSEWRTLAFTTDNVASATKLQTSRTLWGQSFDGTGNVSGDMTGVGSITASGNITTVNGLFRVNATNIAADRGFDAYYRDKRLVFGFGSSGNYGIYAEATGWAMSIHGTHVAITQSSGHNVGIGTTSPAYKLDVAGEIRATSGITIGSTDDYGWYISGAENRIAAGARVARNVNVGSLLVSNLWADYTKVPTNGIYSKGNILSAGNIIAYSSSSRLVKDILPKRTTFSQRLTALGSVVEFRYNGLIDRDRDIHTGLLYENVRDIMPSMCYMHEGYGALNYLDTDYINLIAGSVQEHTDEIAHLKNKVASLEMEVERLRRGLAA